MVFMQIMALLLLVVLGSSFVSATVTCYKKNQNGGVGVGVMLSFIIMIFTMKILMMLLGG